MKKVIVSMLVFVLMTGLIGCGKNDAGQAADTMGGKMVQIFDAEIDKTADLEALCTKIAGVSEMECVVMQVEEGYLNGFSEEVSGFETGYIFAPMIGTIPMVGYIFKTDDPKALEEKLRKIADLRWNICTEAAETVSSVKGDYVFFAMCPGEDDL